LRPPFGEDLAPKRGFSEANSRTRIQVILKLSLTETDLSQVEKVTAKKLTSYFSRAKTNLQLKISEILMVDSNRVKPCPMA
jgi:hypothetical protein